MKNTCNICEFADGCWDSEGPDYVCDAFEALSLRYGNDKSKNEETGIKNPILVEFDKLKNDVDKWRYVQDNQDKDIMVVCDNDDTYIVIESERYDEREDEEDGYAQFVDYIGYSDGVFDLLKAMGIRAEAV